jgi:hydroxymethylpyrimidine/phosphomethylpyrimidine kinase
MKTPVALTIGGSDSGGGAGIQADIKTFTALGCFGTSAITCITAQNPDEVTGIGAIQRRMVAKQIRAVASGFPVAAAKTGMLYSAGIIQAVAKAVKSNRIRVLVVDPVMIATSGASLLKDDAREILCRVLMPLATVVTPNLPEAEALWGHAIRSVVDLCEAARGIGKRFGVACVVKGGHLAGGQVVDVLFVGGRLHEFRGPRVAAKETHGTGCTFSAAVTAGLAHGLSLPNAVRQAKRFVAESLRKSVAVGRHWPLRIGAAR